MYFGKKPSSYSFIELAPLKTYKISVLETDLSLTNEGTQEYDNPDFFQNLFAFL